MLVLLFLSVAGAQLAPNDMCGGAINVTDGQHVGNNTGVPVPAYSQRYDCLYSSDVYYVYYATCRGKVTISALGDTSSGLYLAAFAGTNCAALGPCVWDSSSTYTPASVDVYSAAVGDKIYFGLGSYYTPDTFKFNITCSSQGVAAGDRCPNAITYTSPSIVVSTTNATSKQQFGGSSCVDNDIFIRYNATCDGDATVTVSSSGYDSVAVFYPGTCDQIVGGDWQRSCNSGTSKFPVRANHWYYIAVGYSYETDYTVSFTCDASTRPVNDECEGAISVTSPFTFDATSGTNATRSVPPDVCGSFDEDVWVSYNATCDGDLWLQFNASTDAVAYAGSSCDSALASGCIYGASEFSFPVLTGQTYRIALGAYSYYPVEVNFTCVPKTRPTNDKCASAMPTGTNVSYVIDPRNATTESYVRALSCNRGLVHDIYFLYTTCVGTNNIYVDYNGSIGNVALAASLACGLEPVACGGYSAAFEAPYAFPIVIAVGFGSNPVGFARVDFSCVPYPVTGAPTRSPTAPTTAQPTAAPTAKPTATPTKEPTDADNTTDTAAPTLSGAETLTLSLASLLGFAMLA